MNQNSSIQMRRSAERGYADHGWLKSYHTFSFADYFDRKHMSFRSLRVINEDFVVGGKGFGSHPHKDMEIVTLVLKGELAHKDSMGNSSVIKPGEVQRMSAGTGIVHSEFNNSPKEDVHLFQIWILPANNGLKPSYEQKMFQKEDRTNQLKLIASPNGQAGSVTVHQDVKIYECELSKFKDIEHLLEKGRAVWIQLAQGNINVNGEDLQEGDAIAIEDSLLIKIQAKSDSMFLLFDLA
jgi:redox-sensitive bicupin YhaK (pirin superfamily)